MFLRASTAALILAISTTASAVERWFEDVKKAATPEQLYTFLYALPKGGDLHNHLEGAILSEWMWESALAQKERGYTYYTKVKINNCRDYGTNEFGQRPYLLLFMNLRELTYKKLDRCEQSEYKRLQDLNDKERTAWLNSMRLDQKYEGRDEFFQAHWTRITEILDNPHVVADILYKNMEAFGKEGMVYLETQVGLDGYVKLDGTAYTTDEVAEIFRARLAEKDAVATGVTVRFQNALLRFVPNAEDRLRELYAINDKYRDLYVGVNMVGREEIGRAHV